MSARESWPSQGRVDATTSEDLGIHDAGLAPAVAGAPIWEATVEPDGETGELAIPEEGWLQRKVTDWREKHADARNAPGGWAYTIRHWDPPSIAAYEQSVPEGAVLAVIKALVTLLWIVTDPKRCSRALAGAAVALIVLIAAGVLLGVHL